VDVGREHCHGLVSEHIARPTTGQTVNPDHIDYAPASDACIQCHTQGQPLSNPIEGNYLGLACRLRRWPEAFGFLGIRRPHPRSVDRLPSGSAHRNRMHGKISFGVSYFGAASRASIESAPARPLSVPLRSRTRVDLFVRTPKRTSSSPRPAHFIVMFNAVTPRIAQDVIEIRSAHRISALVSSARVLAGNPAQSRIQPQACPVTQASPSEKRHSERRPHFARLAGLAQQLRDHLPSGSQPSSAFPRERHRATRR
jgi:hypothetical protein